MSAKFTVIGSGSFPFDMLRYDECWPLMPEDASALSREDRRKVELLTNKRFGPTTARWASFGWHVILVK